MDTIIPELMNEENLNTLRKQNGLLLTLDTTLLQHNFLIAQGESDRESDATQRDDGDEFLYKTKINKKNDKIYFGLVLGKIGFEKQR